MATKGSSVVEFSTTCSSEDDTHFDSSYKQNKECCILSLVRHQVLDCIDLTGPSNYERKDALGRVASETQEGTILPAHMVKYVDLEDENGCHVLLGRRKHSPQKRVSHVDRSYECREGY